MRKGQAIFLTLLGICATIGMVSGTILLVTCSAIVVGIDVNVAFLGLVALSMFLVHKYI